MTELDPRAEQVLTFWFLELDSRRWFDSTAETDAVIAERFASLLAEASAAKLDSWSDSPRGLLALVIVLDQFSRTIHRDEAGAFATDRQAQELVAKALERGDDAALTISERQFLYMPLMHAEDLDLQKLGVAKFGELVSAAEDVVRFAEMHRDIVARFGHFPHRNTALDRASTGAERDYLAEHGNPFG